MTTPTEPTAEEVDFIASEIMNYTLDEITMELPHFDGAVIRRHVGPHNARGMAHAVLAALTSLRASKGEG